MTNESELPLAGVKVIDLTTTLYGPCTTQMLGDFGADVIKVEAPGGDPVRDVGPARNPGMSAIFLGANRNKRSIVLDLKQGQAREALWRLTETAGMFVHNMRPHKIATLGFAPQAVLDRCPGIVYGGLHGYREDGPYAERPAYDDVIQGESGAAALYSERDGEPAFAPTVLADKSAALMAAGGLVAAYVKRLRTGLGVYMECTMFEGLVSYNLTEHHYGAMFEPARSEPGYPRALSPERRPHRTRDGYICLLAYTDRQWRAFWSLTDKQALADDPRFATIGARVQNIDALYETAGEVLATRETRDWLTRLEQAQVPAGAVNNLEDVLGDPHLHAVGFYRRFEHPSEGPLVVPDTPYRFDRRSLPIRRAHPRLGEHGREVLAEIGMSEAHIEAALRVTPER